MLYRNKLRSMVARTGMNFKLTSVALQNIMYFVGAKFRNLCLFFGLAAGTCVFNVLW